MCQADLRSERTKPDVIVVDDSHNVDRLSGGRFAFNNGNVRVPVQPYKILDLTSNSIERRRASTQSRKIMWDRRALSL